MTVIRDQRTKTQTIRGNRQNPNQDTELKAQLREAFLKPLLGSRDLQKTWMFVSTLQCVPKYEPCLPDRPLKVTLSGGDQISKTDPEHVHSTVITS